MNHEMRGVLALYGPPDENYGKKHMMLTPEQVDSFLKTIRGRIFPVELTDALDRRIECLVAEEGERLPGASDPRYGSIVVTGTRAYYTPRELRALAEGKTLPLVSEEDQPYVHFGWECGACHPDKYPPPRHLLGGQSIWYDDGRYSIPLELLCRIHGRSIHYRVFVGEELEMQQKCARECRSSCIGYCYAYCEKQKQVLRHGIYYVPGYGPPVANPSEQEGE